MRLTTEITQITLRGGERVSVFELHIRPTYAQLLAGQPTEEYNRSLLVRFAKEAVEWWHDQGEALVLLPSDKQLRTQLPAYRLTALLDCSTPLSFENDGSKVRVVWFSSELPKDIPYSLQRQLGHIDWKQNARDYLL